MKKTPYDPVFYSPSSWDDGDDSDVMSLTIDLKSPEAIVKELDKSVIGQREAKELVATSVFNRLLAATNHSLKRDENEYYFEKSNVLLLGSTGSGKTHLVKALGRAVGLPVVIQDATRFTAAGYVGADIESIFSDLHLEAVKIMTQDEDTMTAYSFAKRAKEAKTLAQFGIVYIDEADKLRTRHDGKGKDINGAAVQESLLKIIEGTVIQKYDIDTSNILFILGGAFTDLAKITAQRIGVKSIGFTNDVETKVPASDILKHSNIADLTEFGIMPELLGRLSTTAVLNDLTKRDIKRILTEPDRCLAEQFYNEFKSYDVTAAFSECAIDLIVEKALELKLGARGLRSVAVSLLRPLLFRLPTNRPTKPIIITRAMLEEAAQESEKTLNDNT